MRQRTSAIVEIRVEHALEDGLGDVLSRHVGVVPGLDNKIDRVLDNRLRDLPSGLVEDERKVVLKWISACIKPRNPHPLTLERNECVGSEAFQSFHTSYWSCESITACDDSPRADVAVPSKGLTKGSRVVMMKTDTELPIFSTKAPRPGIRSMVFYKISRLLCTDTPLPTHLDLLHDRIAETEDLPQHRV